MRFGFEYKEFEAPNICSVGVAILGSAVIGAATTAYTSSKAAKAQTSATERSAQIAQQQYAQTRADFEPFRQAGVRATAELESRLPFLTSPIEMTQEFLESTPGYQFTRTQGLKSVQNSAAARGLGVSGAALKGAAEFATGLADKTYGEQFNRENTNRTNAYNRLMGLIDTGRGASGVVSNAGTAAAKQVGDAAIGAGNAQAAAWNTVGGSVNNMSRDFAGYQMYKGLYDKPVSPAVSPGAPSWWTPAPRDYSGGWEAAA